MKQKLYWWLLQLNKIGGTEMVSISIMNKLCDDYDITIISSAELIDIAYEIDPRIKIISLGIPQDVMTIDQSLARYSQQKACKKYFKTIFSAIRWMIFKRHGIRKNVEKMISENNAILVCSAIDSYWLAPKKGRVFFHFHFNKNVYFSFSNKIVMSLTRKPEKLVFLSSATMNQVCKKYPKLKTKSCYIHNGLRFKGEELDKYNNNSIFFLGRFSPEKNPMFVLKVAKELKNRDFKFNLTVSGYGALEKDMQEYIKINKLNDCVSIIGPTLDVKNALRNYDLVIVPSLHEGFGLTIIEANSMSVPVISSNWGDAISEVMDNDVNGYVIDDFDEKKYADKIIEILSDKDKLIKLKHSAYAHSLNFDLDKIINEWKNILK